MRHALLATGSCLALIFAGLGCAPKSSPSPADKPPAASQPRSRKPPAARNQRPNQVPSPPRQARPVANGSPSANARPQGGAPKPSANPSPTPPANPPRPSADKPESLEPALAEAPSESASGAERALFAGKIDDERLLMTGPAADGRFGDFALKNARVHAVVTAPGHVPYLAHVGGLVADFGFAERRMDFFGFMSPSLANPDKNPFQCEAKEVRVANDGSSGEAAEIEVLGTVAGIEGLAFKTTYRLRPDSKSLEIETEWRNEGTARTPDLNPIDWVHWGSLSLFVPNHGLTSVLSQQIEEVEGTWVAGVGALDDALVAVYSDNRALKGRHQRNFSNIAWASRRGDKRALAPGQTLTLKRFLRPGTGDIASTTNEILAEQTFPTAEIYGRVFDTTPERKAVAGARIRLDQVTRADRQKGTKSGMNAYSQTRTNAAGEFVFRTPPGEFVARGNEPTRVQPPRTVSQFLDPGGVAEKEILMAPPQRLAFEVTDADTGKPIPCKVAIVASRNQFYHYLGPPWEAPYSRNTYYSVSGSGVIEVPKGTYQVVISRGPEYTIYSEAHTFTRKHVVEPLRLEVQLKRIVDTTGWVAVDIGSHTASSWDSLVSEEDRVISAVAEGVELVIPADYNAATDLRDDIERLALGQYVKAGLGFELRDPKRRGAGDFTVFPVDDSALEAGPALEALAAESDPATLFASLRERFPGALIQANLPLDPEYGYFVRHGYDVERGGLFYASFDEAYSADYDLVEVMRGRTRKKDSLEAMLEPWHQLILSGDTAKRFGGGSASRSVHGEEIGYPRLYVKSSTDDPAKIDLAEIAENIRRGAVILTSGPFLEFEVMDAGPGGWTQPGEDGLLYYETIASAPEWIQIHRVSGEKEGFFFNRALIITRGDPIQYPPPNEMERVRRLKALRDWCAYMTAEGAETMEPVLARMSPDPLDAPVPLAVTGPVFFDYDKDGKYTPPAPTRRHRN